MTATIGSAPSPIVLPGRGQAVALAVVAGSVAVVGSIGADPARALVGGLTLLVLFVVSLQSRALAVSGLVGWLVVLGFTRRFLIPFSGWSDADPLLLVGPAGAVLLLLTARGEAPPPRAAIASLALFNVLWTLASVLNPNERDLVAAAQSLLFFVAPYLWIFVGRRLTSDEHDRVLRVLCAMGVAVVALGLYQTFVGLLPFEYTWLSVANVDPALIYVRGFNIRPFSTLTSPQEYGLVLGFIGLTVWARILLRAGRRWMLWTALGVLTVTTFYQGSRGIFLSFTAVAILLTMVRRRGSPLPFIVATFLVFGSYVISQGFDLEVDAQSERERERASTATALFRHQLEGLLNPSDTTAGLHVDIYLRGFTEGLQNPVGLGPTRYAFASDGSTALVGPDGQRLLSPENQLSVTISSLGIPPAVALLSINVIGVVAAVALYRREPTPRHLAWIGILLMAGEQSLNGRLYLASTIAALVLGGVATEWQRSSPARTP